MKSQRFQRWMSKRGIEYSDAIELHFGDKAAVVSGSGVTALCSLKQGELIATIPKTACLTILTTGASEVLQSAQLGGGIGLAVAIMYERSKGAKSPWSPYLDMLPKQENVPLVWSEQEIDDLLMGTELHQVVKQDRQFMKEDWEEHIVPLTENDPQEFPEKFFSFECYLAARTLVSSRSFEVDEYHGHGMVPLADLFNHKTAAEDVHIMSNGYGDASDGDSDQEETQVLEMILVKDVEKHKEIFNTYGQLGNAALLHRYGFTELNNPFDIVNIDMLLIVEVLTRRGLTPKHIRERVKLWRKAGFVACDESQYFEIDHRGSPQVELLMLLFLMHSSARACKRLDKLATKVKGNAKRALQVINGSNHKIMRNFGEAWLLTPFVKKIVKRAVNARDKQYGTSSSLEDDEIALENMPYAQPAFQALRLRVMERMILCRCKQLMH